MTKKYVDDNSLSLSDLDGADLRVSSVFICTGSGHHDALVVMATQGKTMLDIDSVDEEIKVGAPIQYTGSEDIVISDVGGDYDSGSGSGSEGSSTPIFVTDKAVVEYVDEKLSDLKYLPILENIPLDDIKIKGCSLQFENTFGIYSSYSKCNATEGKNLIYSPKDLVIKTCGGNLTFKTVDSTDKIVFNQLPETNNDYTPSSSKNLVPKKYVDDQISTKLGTVFTYKGNKDYASLPTTGNKVGDVYNLTSAFGDYKVGDNVVWDGSAWDKLAATVDTSAFLDKNYTGLQTVKSSGVDFEGCVSVENNLRTYSLGVNEDAEFYRDAYVYGCLYVKGSGLISDGSVSTTYLDAYDVCIRKSIYVNESAHILCGRVSIEGCSFAPTGFQANFDENITLVVSGPAVFRDTVSINELAVQELSIENLSVGEEITINNIPVVGSIEALQKKTGVFTQVLPAKTASNGTVEYQVVFNTDSTKTVLAPPNVVVTDITGAREKYVLVTTEWDENTVYLTFDEGNVKANTYKVYITNIQLA